MCFGFGKLWTLWHFDRNKQRNICLCFYGPYVETEVVQTFQTLRSFLGKAVLPVQVFFLVVVVPPEQMIHTVFCCVSGHQLEN